MQIEMEHQADLVAEGRLIHETAYSRRSDRYREVQIGPIKIDFYDPAARVIHETKKSDKMEDAHIAQVKYYIWVLEQHSITGVTGLIEYPTLRQTREVVLTDQDRLEIPRWIADIEAITSDKTCPARIKKTLCKRCSYFDFCWVDEKEADE
jgi:CRISPR-associated exonuclease Cas4